MQVLVTGVNGFIGRCTAAAFRSADVEVTGTDLHEKCAVPGITYIRADLTEDRAPELLAQAGPYDSVVHLAASLAMHSADVLWINPLSTYHTLSASVLAGCQHFLHLSSIPVIGLPPETGMVTEQTPASPRTLYHISKCAAEQTVLLPEFGSMRRYNLRIASPIGPGMPSSFLRIMLRAAAEGKPLTLYGSGSRVQNYIDVRDAAAALVQIVLRQPPEGLYLLGGVSCSNIDAARICVKITNRNSDILFAAEPDPSDDERWFVDSRKAVEAFGFSPRYSLERSLQDMLEVDL